MQQLNDFKTWLTINTSAKTTARSYYYNMKQFFDFSSGNISNELIQKYFLHIIESGKSTSTFNQFRKALYSYNQFSKSNFEIPKLKREDTKMIEDFITEDELNYIISYLPKIFEDSFPVEIILKILFYTGLRKTELINLRREDINLEKGFLKLKNTKSNRDEIVDFPKSLIPSIRAYFIKVPEIKNTFNLTQQIIDDIFIKINQELNFRIHLHPHLFRHSCCKYLLNKFGIEVVQVLMRHANINTTARYSTKSRELQSNLYHQKIK